MDSSAVAAAHPNIALIKYWGNRDDSLRLPRNGSLSMTLAGLHTVTRVRFDDRLAQDTIALQHRPASAEECDRVSRHLDLIRSLAGMTTRAAVDSASDFPVGAGLASSASAFAALTVAASSAAGLLLHADELSRLARRGSGSACRSIFGGFVEWFAGEDDRTSLAAPLAEAGHWELVDLIAIVSSEQKPVGSSQGHRLAATSPLQEARVATANARLARCRRALLARDFETLADVVELDSHLMHAVMQTSTPSLLYWSPASVGVMRAVREWRAAGVPVCYTLDAGPNVHCLCPAEAASGISPRLQTVPGVIRVLVAPVGAAARVLTPGDPLFALL